MSFKAEEKDSWRWVHDNDGRFSVRRLKELLDSRLLGNEDEVMETTWCNYVPKKVRIFLWRLRRGKLPVRFILDKLGIDMHSTLCPSCDDEVESIDHCFVKCKYAKLVWDKVYNWWGKGNVLANNVNEMLDTSIDGSNRNAWCMVWKVVVWCTCYFLWKNRNEKVFRPNKKGVMDVFFEVQLNTFFWLKHRVKNFNVGWEVWYTGPRQACI